MGPFAKPAPGHLSLAVTLGCATVTVVLIVIVDATSLQTRRHLAAKGHAQGHTAHEVPRRDRRRTLLRALSLGSARSAWHSHWGGGETRVFGGAKTSYSLCV